MTYAAINQQGPTYFTLVVMWGFGPVYLDTVYQSRSKARYALNKLVGKDRTLVSMTKLYKIHKGLIDAAFKKAREPVAEREANTKAPIVIDASGYNQGHNDYNTFDASFRADLKRANPEAFDFMYGNK